MSITESEELQELRNQLQPPELVLLCFHAGWCPHCPETERACEALATGFQVRYAEVNVADAEGLVVAFGVQRLPTVLLLDAETEVARMSGSHANPDAVRDGVKRTCARQPLSVSADADF